MKSNNNKKTKYKTVRLPGPLVDNIKALINEHKDLGYRTHTEFIVEATRTHLFKIKMLKNQ